MSVSSQIEESAVTLVVFGICVLALIYAYRKLFPHSADSQPLGSGAYQKLGDVLGPAESYNDSFPSGWGGVWKTLSDAFVAGPLFGGLGSPDTAAAAPAGTSVSDYNPNLAPGDIPAISQAFQNWS